MDLYSQAISVGAATGLIAILCLWPLRRDLRALRPEWLRRGILGWAVGSWFDVATIYNRQVYRTRATRFTIWSIRLLVLLSGTAFLIAKILFDRL